MTPKMYIVAAAVVAVTLGVAALVAAGYWKGSSDGKISQLKDTVDAYRERSTIDAGVRGRSDYQLCIGLGGMPDQCEQLRRLDQASPAK